MIRKVISHILVLLVLFGTSNGEMLRHEHSEGHSICNIDCNDENHCGTCYDCEKCYNLNQRFIVDKSFKFYQGKNYVNPIYVEEFFKSIYSDFHLYSRPPPSLL